MWKMPRHDEEVSETGLYLEKLKCSGISRKKIGVIEMLKLGFVML